MAYPNQVYTAFSFVGFIMCIIPLPCHLKAWNIGTCLYIFWTGTGCLIFCVNSIIWHGNAVNWSPIWCEICTRIIVAGSFGIPASSLCVNRRLYLVQLSASENRTRFNKKRTIIIDLIVGLGLPLLSIPLYYVSQGHRFNILEDIGCQPAIYNSWVALVTVFLPPVLIGFVSAIYAVLSIISINKMRTRFKQLIASNLNVSYNLYLRLMALAGIEAVCTVPITSLYVYLNGSRLAPWISWEDTHSNFDRVDQYPALWRIIWGPTVASQVELTRWLYVVCSILFFGFFGVAEEVRRLYGPAFRYVCERVGIHRNREIANMTFKLGSVSQASRTMDNSFPGTIDTLVTQTSFSDVEKRGDEWHASKTFHDVQDHRELDNSEIHTTFSLRTESLILPSTVFPQEESINTTAEDNSVSRPAELTSQRV